MASRRNTAERIALAVQRLARDKPVAQIRLSDVARESGLSWPTVKRHVDSSERLQAIAEGEIEPIGEPDSRARLLSAAASQVARHGYDAASLDAIAAEAGLTKGAIYWHFESKQGLFAELIREVIGAGAPSGGNDARQTIFRWLGGSHVAPRLLLEVLAAGRSPAIRAVLVERLRGARERDVARIEELQQRGLLASGPAPRDVADLLTAVAVGTSILSAVDPDALDMPTYLPEVARLLALALGADAAG